MTLSTPVLFRDRTIALLLWLAAIVLFCVDLNGVPLRDWDEGLVAQVAREISRSDRWTGWLYPQLWGEPYFNKPPLLHTLVALTYRLWGVHTWTARLPGAVLTSASVPLLYCLGRAVFPTRAVALLGACVYLTWLPVVRHGRLAMLDGAVICFFIATLWMLVRSHRSSNWFYGVGLGFALMCLTKGLLGVLLLGLALVFLAWDYPKAFTIPALWRGLLLGSIPVLVWYGLQWQLYGQTFIDAGVVNQSISRIWNAVEDHQGPPWYYLLEILKYSWPWLIFFPMGVRLVWRSRHHSWGKLILVWLLCYLLPISLMGTKLPWYVFPVYPALALTCAVALSAAWEMHRHWSGRLLSLKQLPITWGLSLGLVALIGLGGISYASPWGGEPSTALLLSFLSVAIATGTASFLVWRQRLLFIPILIIGAYTSLLCLMMSDHWVWELGESFAVTPVAELVRNQVPPEAPLYLQYAYARPSLNFYCDRLIPAASAQELQTLWQQPPPIYILTSDPSSYQTLSKSFTDLGIAENFHLISNQPYPG
jgi:4-amino-4-deoxy-L-arabinose transferase-like glycosyltransferase